MDGTPSTAALNSSPKIFNSQHIRVINGYRHLSTVLNVNFNYSALIFIFSNRSINELEVIHGVLKYIPSDKLGSFAEAYEPVGETGELPRDVLFYYRDQSFTQKIPIKKKVRFVSESYSAKSLLNDMKYRLNLAGLPSKNYR